MSQPNAAPRRWTEKELTQRFGWWWREPAEAFRVAFPKLSDINREALFRGTLNQCALNYELVARHDLKPGASPVYEFGMPFHRLPARTMSSLLCRWPNDPWPPMFEVLDEGAQPDVTLMLARLHESISDDGGEAVKREHERRAVARDRIETTEAKCGWTVPRYFRFNLGAHTTGTILTALGRWLNAQRKTFNFEKPRPNQNRANRSKRGLSFRAIEALDVWTHLPRAEAKLVHERMRFDESLKRHAVREAKSLVNRAASKNRTGI